MDENTKKIIIERCRTKIQDVLDSEGCEIRALPALVQDPETGYCSVAAQIHIYIKPEDSKKEVK